MKTTHQRPAFTIVEVLVAICLLGVVIGLALSVYGHGVRLSRQTACLSNLRQLALGLNAYYTEYGRLPADDRPTRFDDGLLPVIQDRRVFRCPADPRKGASSYAPYYVQRRELTPSDFVLGCPRHADGRVAAVLYGNAGSEGNVLGRVTHNGTDVAVGDRVTGGLVRFADGSVASLGDGVSADILTSFERDDGSYYTIVRLPVGEAGWVGVDVNPNSRLEVIAPAAIAGSEGTKFYVCLGQAGTVTVGGASVSVGDHMMVYVKTGAVRVTAKGTKGYTRLLSASDCVYFEEPNGAITDCQAPPLGALPALPGDPSIVFPPP